LQRFQQEYAFRTVMQKIPEVNENILSEATSPLTVQVLDLKSAISNFIGTEYMKMYLSENGGSNLFTAGRVALCFQLHGQSVFSVLGRLEKYRNLFQLEESELDIVLAEKLGRASQYHSFQMPNYKNTDPSLIDELSVDAVKIQDLMDHAREMRILFPRSCPKSDIIYTITAMYYDGIYQPILKELDELSQSLEITHAAYGPSILDYAPILAYQDSKYLETYRASRPCNDFDRAFNLCKTNIPIQAPKYTHYEGGCFREVDEPTKLLVQAVQKLNPLSVEAKAHFLSSLIRMNTGPDIMIEIQDSAFISDDELNAANHVVKRFLTSEIVETMQGALRIITASQYRFHMDNTNLDKIEFYERLGSILLGYGYAYKASERPDIKYLDVNDIIRFLFNNREFIEDETRERFIRQFHKNYGNSPLVQHVVSLQPKDRRVVIDNLYQAWKRNDLLYLNKYIVQILSPARYEECDPTQSMIRRNERLKDEFKSLANLEEQLKAYASFLDLNSKLIVFANAEANIAPIIKRIQFNDQLNGPIKGALSPQSLF